MREKSLLARVTIRLTVREKSDEDERKKIFLAHSEFFFHLLLLHERISSSRWEVEK